MAKLWNISCTYLNKLIYLVFVWLLLQNFEDAVIFYYKWEVDIRIAKKITVQTMNWANQLAYHEAA